MWNKRISGKLALLKLRYVFTAITFGVISESIMMRGVTTEIEIKCPYSPKYPRRKLVTIAASERLTKRLPIRIVASILSGVFISDAIALSLLLLERDNRCRSAFLRENKAVSVPGKKAERIRKTKAIAI